MTYRGILYSIVTMSMYFVPCAASAWEPAEGPLMTRWSKDVSPDRVWPEYPRPQMVRQSWMNLNGLWKYAIRPAAEGEPSQWDGEILVPFAVESALSGVKKPVRPNERLWYRRTVELPPLKDGQRLLLHFGAVDWRCAVWVDGQKIGEHTGGHDPFTFDITDALQAENGSHEIVVAVSDPTDKGYQPRGKQVLKPHGIFYTAVTGIWQTVWLETVPETPITALKIVPDIDRKAVLVTVTTKGGDGVRLRATHDGQAVGEAKGGIGEAVEVAVPTAKLWSPGTPHLYQLEVELLNGDEVVDTVESYFGMRKIEVKKDAEGINRLWLNDEVVFQYGPLDQGWWPDGLYTAPTDEALKYDIEMTKRLGMNMARKHVKIEPARWYYWCDTLGLLVWQDMPSGDADRNEESKKNYRRELKAMIDALHSFPSIVMWVPFNEGWGQHDTEEVVKWLQQYDPTRPINEASGWHDKGSGDVTDMHNYPGPGMREPEADRVSVLGEFGGLGMPVRDHTWQNEKNWGYVSYNTADELTDAYIELLTLMRPLIGRGLSAAVYTQTTDVEIEVNGLMTYDRALVKMDESRITEAAQRLYLPPPQMHVVAPTSEASPHSWRYTTAKAEENWHAPEFDDSGWEKGPAGFGTEGTPRGVVRTTWDSPEIWLRRSFELESAPEGARLMLTIHHDDDAEVYLNGTLVRAMKGHTRHYRPVLLEEHASSLLHAGKNTLAVYCRNSSGGQYVDVGLSVVSEQ
jgi:Glycosyl hydrolases family 2, sugar binding domain/Glycosyl hydrolases family 2/Glycosyl hydrolases family 2, TIM barrel domain